MPKTEAQKAAHRERQRQYALENREKVLASKAAYREKNRELLRQKNKAYAESHKERLRETAKEYREKNRGRINDYWNAWYAKRARPVTFSATADTDGRIAPAKQYKPKRRNYKADVTRKKARYAADPNYRQRVLIHNAMWELTRGKVKSGKMFDLLGCDIEQFSRWIESQFEEGMDFDNLGEWEVDHVRPLSSFDLTDETQLREACHYTNTRPLWWKQNRQKKSPPNKSGGLVGY
jgi:hypothetical protein